MKDTSDADDQTVLAKAGLDSLIYLHILQAFLSLFTVRVKLQCQQMNEGERRRQDANATTVGEKGCWGRRC